MSNELEPCPFCRGNAAVNFVELDERQSYGRSAWVQCGKCGARTANYYHDEKPGYAVRETANPKAIAAWNTRAIQQDTVAGEVERLREALERLSSMEAFVIARAVNPDQDAELLARIDFARAALLVIQQDTVAGEVERRPQSPVIGHGCICPPGSERTCRGPLCPRQSLVNRP
jgi:Lar family restriction alleviation protein